MAEKDIVKSLDKISDNLAAINNTITTKKNEEAKVEKPKDVDFDSLIENFIDKIDNEKSLFKTADNFHGMGMTLFNIVLLGILVFALPFVPDLSTGEKIGIGIAVVAIIATFIPTANENLVSRRTEANFQKALEKFNIEKREEEKRLLLEALLKMKAINSGYKLATVKKIHPEILTKRKAVRTTL